MEQPRFLEAITQIQTIFTLLHHCSADELLALAAADLGLSPRELGDKPARIVTDGGSRPAYREALADLTQNVIHLDRLYRSLPDRDSRLVFYDQLLTQLLPDIPDLPVEAAPHLCSDTGFLPQQPAEIWEGDRAVRALLDQKARIRDTAPVLAVRLIPHLHRLWLIPSLLDSINADYTLYLRYDAQGVCVLYAVPPVEAVSAQAGRKRTVLALCYERGWHNAELVKDRICIPYLLYKLYGYEVRIIGERVDDDYSNLDYIPGVDMEFVDCWDNQAKYAYLEAHAQELDLITLPECQYGIYAPLIQVYKQHNPAGKVLLTLDANSGWADRVPQNDPSFRFLMDSCDLICASSRSIQHYLNAKWPWRIEYLPNGFYDFAHCYQPPVFAEKENIILTVGRLGTLAKATDTLLNAFSLIAGQLPDWKLRLVGPVAPEFRPWLEGFFAQHPELREQIQFAGPVMDRALLSREYRRAKVFALPSRFEGTPNVMAEALVHGCATCFTNIDACADAIDQGRCGTWACIDDVEGYAGALLALCRSDRLEKFSRRACLLGRTTLDMERAVARVHALLFGEEVR